jgi:hypothetical protein
MSVAEIRRSERKVAAEKDQTRARLWALPGIAKLIGLASKRSAESLKSAEDSVS